MIAADAPRPARHGLAAQAAAVCAALAARCCSPGPSAARRTVQEALIGVLFVLASAWGSCCSRAIRTAASTEGPVVGQILWVVPPAPPPPPVAPVFCGGGLGPPGAWAPASPPSPGRTGTATPVWSQPTVPEPSAMASGWRCPPCSTCRRDPPSSAPWSVSLCSHPGVAPCPPKASSPPGAPQRRGRRTMGNQLKCGWRVLAVIGGLCATGAVQAAGGHHAVDDAQLLEPGQCELESWLTRAGRRARAASRRRLPGRAGGARRRQRVRPPRWRLPDRLGRGSQMGDGSGGRLQHRRQGGPGLGGARAARATRARPRPRWRPGRPGRRWRCTPTWAAISCTGDDQSRYGARVEWTPARRGRWWRSATRRKARTSCARRALPRLGRLEHGPEPLAAPQRPGRLRVDAGRHLAVRPQVVSRRAGRPRRWRPNGGSPPGR